MKKKKQYKSIENKLKERFVLGVSILFFILTIIYVIKEKDQLLNNLRGKSKISAGKIHSIITMGMKNSQIKRFINITAATDKIKRLIILNENGKVISSNKNVDIVDGLEKFKNEFFGNDKTIPLEMYSFRKALFLSQIKFKINNQKEFKEIRVLQLIDFDRHKTELFTNLLIFILGGGVFFVILLKSFIIFIKHSILTPVTEITDYCSDYAKGKISKKLEYDSNDEIRVIFNTLNKMIEDIESQKDELIRSLKKAQAAEKTKSEFLANMSHEIRTPMNGILGMISLVKETELTDEQNEMMDLVGNCGDGLLVILNDILDFSKIESGELEIESINFNIKKVIKEAILLISDKAVYKGIKLLMNFSENSPEYLMGDSTRVRQILLNLLTNALKFTHEGNISVVTDSKRLDNNRHLFTIKIIDTGIGISKTNQDKLFKSFSQADASITRRYGGTGLGLSICSNLCRIMKGEIGLESEEGKGSTFYFSLPFLEGESNREGKEKFFEEQVRIDPKILKSKILIVDDNNVNRQLAEKMLLKLGFSCDLAVDGFDCLNKMESTKYDLILMDIQMPKLDGIGATKEIVKRYGNERPKIIAVTANVFQENKKKCFEVGMDFFMEKPLKISNMKRTLIKELSSLFEEKIPLDILVVEDDLVSFKVIFNRIQKLGHKVIGVHDGQKAIELCQENFFDLIFMDFQLPTINGLETSKKIQGNTNGNYPIFVVTSAELSNEIQNEFKKINIYYFIEKIASSQEIRTLILGIFKDEKQDSA